MALNFPVDTSSPYVDPTTGLKYVYNASVGAWESALQPPVIVGTTTPTTAIEGFLWYNTSDNILYVYRGGSWDAVSTASASGSEVRVSNVPIAVPTVGDLWWDTVEGQLYIYYTDPDGGSAWMPCSPTIVAPGGGAFVDTTSPLGPVTGDFWFNTINDSLNVYDGASWVVVKDQVVGVQSVTGTAPITVDNTDADNPIVGISQATNADQGTVRFATQLETDTGTANDVALTPSTLTNGIENYLPQATEIAKGAIELATSAEVIAGTDTIRAVTPATLVAAAPSLGLAVPPGIINQYAGSVAPGGYLLCDGSAVDRTTYADLFAVISTTYGVGDGSTTFNLPDLRGEFVRGLDNSRGIDSGRVLGSFQDHEIEAHTHTGTSGNAGSDPTKEGGGRRDSDDGTYTTGSTGGTETRPRNVALNFIIKT